MKYRTIILLIALLVLPASASDSWSNSKEPEKNLTILSWSPQVVDNVYVNNTVNMTITYSVTLPEQMTVNTWALDGMSVNGVIDNNTVSYINTWDNQNAGFHILIYEGRKNNSQITFKWYVNVYEMERYRGGNIFDVIDDVLENHATDVKVRMLKYTITQYGSRSNFTIQRFNGLYDEIARKQSLEGEVRPESLKGDTGLEGSIPSLKQAQRDIKYNMKLANEMLKIAREDMRDEKLADEIRKISEIGDDRGKEQKEDSRKEKDIGKGKEIAWDSADSNKNDTRDNNWVSKEGEGNSGNSGSSGNSGGGNSGNSESSVNSGGGNSGNSGSSGKNGGGKSGNSGSSGKNGGGNSGNSGSSGKSGGGKSGNNRN